LLFFIKERRILKKGSVFMCSSLIASFIVVSLIASPATAQTIASTPVHPQPPQGTAFAAENPFSVSVAATLRFPREDNEDRFSDRWSFSTRTCFEESSSLGALRNFGRFDNGVSISGNGLRYTAPNLGVALGMAQRQEFGDSSQLNSCVTFGGRNSDRAADPSFGRNDGLTPAERATRNFMNESSLPQRRF
jgi:hypothetical protein